MQWTAETNLVDNGRNDWHDDSFDCWGIMWINKNYKVVENGWLFDLKKLKDFFMQSETPYDQITGIVLWTTVGCINSTLKVPLLT